MHTLGVAQETGTQGQKKRLNSPCKSQALPRAAPQPRGEAGESQRRCQEHFHTHTARVPPKYR